MEAVNDLTESPPATPRLQQSEKSDQDATVTAIDSSPLPARPKHAHSLSTARKRTNDEAWEPVEPPKPSPTTPRFAKSETASPPKTERQRARGSPFASPGRRGQTAPSTPRKAGKATTGMAPTENETFVTSIEQYQRQLELEFREFEQSLTRRDTTAAGDLDPLDWDDLQAQYDREIQPNLAAEQEIMNEFGARFEQFMLYMQVSNDYEAERAIKRLRTRIAVAQNSEASLAQKQTHYAKVVQAFQSAMELLGNV